MENIMNVPFFDLKRLYRLTEHDVDRAIRHTLESGHYILGSQVQKFEEEMKELLVSSAEGYVVGCNSATDALILSMLCVGIGPGDEVIAPSHTAIPTITAIRSTGAVPRFVDVDSKSWLLDLNDIINVLTPKTKAIIAVHLYGNLVNIFKLREYLKAHQRIDLKIIEDCAQAQGSRLNHKGLWFEAGTMGDFGCYSFYPTKNIGAIGDGGAIFVRHESHALQLRMLRNYGQQDRYNAIVERGLNSRLDEIQAAILSARLKYLNKWNFKKSEMMNTYRLKLANKGLEFQNVIENSEINWHLAVIRFKDKLTRNSAQQYMQSKGVSTLIHYPIPTHKQKAFEAYSNRALPQTEKLADEILSLPLNPTLTQEESEHVINCLLQF